MRTIKAVLAYNGSDFCGWQVQKNSRSVQSVVENALHKIHGRRIPVTAASRTDSGVHAEGQVIHFKTRSRLKEAELKNALNFYLPKNVTVKELMHAEDGFHARFQARQKHYRYVIFNSANKPVFDDSFVQWVRPRLSIQRMRLASRALRGAHDFTSFSSAKDGRQSKKTRLKEIRIRRRKDYVWMDFVGERFMRNMVRIMAGTLIDVGLGKRRKEELPGILKAKSRRMASATAGAKGLRLVKVDY